MILTESILKELHKLDIALWKKYKPDDTKQYEIPTDYRILDYLRCDIETIMSNTPAEQWNEYITKILSQSDMYIELLPYLKLNQIKSSVKIRKNWKNALQNIRKGNELSSQIQYKLSNDDIIELTKLHTNRRYKKKIEDLLTDCNMHHECGMLVNGQHEKLIKELTENE